MDNTESIVIKIKGKLSIIIVLASVRELGNSKFLTRSLIISIITVINELLIPFLMIFLALLHFKKDTLFNLRNYTITLSSRIIFG